jgi:hypothetical protein
MLMARALNVGLTVIDTPAVADGCQPKTLRTVMPTAVRTTRG